MKIISGSRRRYYAARFGVFLVTLALIAGMVGFYGVGGNDTPPSQNLEIRTWYDLDAVRDNLSGNHTLINDLDSTTPGYTELASPTANQGKGWDPIGFFVITGGGCGGGGYETLYAFEGTFDGQGHEIRDLFINRPDEMFVGLFHIVVGGHIENIGVVNVTVIGDCEVGGLVGHIEDATVSNSYATGNVAGARYKVGGLVGCILHTSVSDSYSTGNVNGHSDVGGLAGDNYHGIVINSYSTGNVNGDYSVGGLLGHLTFGTVSKSYSTGSVTGESYAGGLVGSNVDSTVIDSYSTGNVSGGQDVGGLVGSNGYEATVSNSYSTGSVTGNEDAGGLVGLNDESTVSDSFWDIETSGQATSDGGTGKNTTEMKNIATFSGAGWNITAVAPGSTNTTYIWNIVHNVTYPFLNWQS